MYVCVCVCVCEDEEGGGCVCVSMARRQLHDQHINSLSVIPERRTEACCAAGLSSVAPHLFCLTQTDPTKTLGLSVGFCCCFGGGGVCLFVSCKLCTIIVLYT